MSQAGGIRLAAIVRLPDEGPGRWMESGAELLSLDDHFSSIDGLAWRRLQAF